ncbi:MAG: autotransporter assembly complex family protein [Thiomicrospira sp.]
MTLPRLLILSLLISFGWINYANANALVIDVRSLDGREQTLLQTLGQELSLALLKQDQYPAQTDFLFRLAPKELQARLQARGYYQAQIEPHLQRSANETRARFDVRLGPAVLMRELRLNIRGEGANLQAWQTYREYDLRLQNAKIFTHQDYESTLQDLLNLAHNNGYLDARFSQREFHVYPERERVEVFITLDTGEAYRFGTVRFNGQQRVSETLLHRFVEFDSNDAFNQNTLFDLQQHLIGSRYFGMVRVLPNFQAVEDNTIPVTVDLEENPPHRYKLGAGYGTDSGARLLLGFENRLVNSRGHRYELDSLIGQNKQLINVTYAMPGTRPSRQQWLIGIGWDASQSDQLKRNRASLVPEYVYQMDNGWLVKPYLSLERETYQYRAQPKRTTQVVVTGINLQKRVANNDSYTTQGYRHQLGLRTSIGQLWSDSEFAQLELSSKGIISPRPSWRFIARARAVLTQADRQQTLPSSYRYLLGGELLRGFAFESIGVTNKQGQIEGANNMLLGSIESDLRFSKYLGAALFTDIGQVYNTEPNSHFKQGAGIGLRGFTPIGIIRLDMAWPISEQVRPWHFHLSIGLDL